MLKTKIPYVDKTWNPITGCSAISEGCKNCYAKRMANRLRGRYGYPADDPFKVTFHPDRLKEPEKWKKPCKVFVCSMGDLFHEDVDDFDFEQARLDIWHIMESCPQHTFLILTKRPAIMRGFCMTKEPMKHIWLGVTAENQDRADDRIPILLSIPAAVHFVSIEPMLGPVNLNLCWECQVEPRKCHEHNKIDWVIAGPETGPGARECKSEWIEDLYEQCCLANIPFFDKRKNYIKREFPK